MPRFAWYSAQSADRQFKAEDLLGKTLDFRAVINSDSRDGFKTTSSWLFSDQYLGRLIKDGKYRKIWWSAPGFWKGGNLKDASEGKYNLDYEALARDIIDVERRKGNTQGDIEFRPWFEFNGSWFFWNWVGKETQGAEAWRQMYNAMKNVSDRFKFEFAPSETTQYTGNFANIENCWPGNGYVDKCGLDLYWKPFESWGWGKDPDVAFQSALTSRYGLTWLENFAKDRGNKPMVLSEVGVQGHNNTTTETINATPYVQKLAAWCTARNVPVLWWNGTSTEGYLGDIISHENWPALRAAVKQHFVDPSTNAPGQNDGPSEQEPETPDNPNPPPNPTSNQQILLVINSDMYNVRGVYPDPLNSLFRSVEDRSYWPLVAAGIKTDTLKPGVVTDPVSAMHEIWKILRVPRESLATAPRVIADKVLDAIKPILAAAGYDVSDPVIVVPEPEPSEELVAAKAKLADLNAFIAQAKMDFSSKVN